MYGNYSEIYSQWCDHYDPENIELKTISKYVELREKDTIDIGCGTGRFLFRLLPYVKSVIGVDNDPISIAVLKNKILQKGDGCKQKSTIICSGIEDIAIPSETIDIAFFSWSLYALNKKQMEQAIQKVFHMLRKDGKLIILQPTGGEFETVMRIFFKEHEDEGEYAECVENMNAIIPLFFDLMAADEIISHFIVSDLSEFCEALKMFAVTEGGCSKDELDHICLEALYEPMSSYRKGGNFYLEDEVSIFIYSKKEVISNGYS